MNHDRTMLYVIKLKLTECYHTCYHL